jgi:hypothetical protein
MAFKLGLLAAETLTRRAQATDAELGAAPVLLYCTPRHATFHTLAGFRCRRSTRLSTASGYLDTSTRDVCEVCRQVEVMLYTARHWV